MSAYNLRFSNPVKTNLITVNGIENGSGLNTIDTSLELVGNGYPDYARALSQNFLKLLENFSSPYPPDNPIEGQLWYDTSDNNRKILKINNGILSSSRWHPAGEVFRQPTDPALGYPSTVNDGVLWSDTATGKLKIQWNSIWMTIGPSVTTGSSKTGVEVAEINDIQDNEHNVTIIWSNGVPIEIISDSEFIPKISINGFSTIKKGSTLTSNILAKYNGLSDKSLSLQSSTGKIFTVDNLLKNTTNYEQIHTGTFVVESSLGFFVKNKSVNKSINLYNNSSGSFINADNNSTLRIGVVDQSFIKFNGLHKNIGINTATSSVSATLDVYGSGNFSDTLTVSSNSQLNHALIINGSSNFNSNVNISNDLNIEGTATIVNRVILGNQNLIDVPVIEPLISDNFNIGSPDKIFRTVHTKEIKGVNTSSDSLHVYGTLYGPATKLVTPRNFSFSTNSDIESSTVSFDGTSAVQFDAYIKETFITSKSQRTSNEDCYFIAVDKTSSTYNKIDSLDLLKDKTVTGTIIMYPSISNPGPEYLLCNGQEILPNQYTTLYEILQGDGINPVTLPNITSITVGSYTLDYFIKI